MSGKNAPEWSGTFQRLRAEAVVLSLLLYIFTHANVNLKRIPILGIEIDGEVPKGSILLFLGLFVVYFLFSWFVRFRNERNHQGVDFTGAGTIIELLQSPIDRTKWSIEDEEKIYNTAADMVVKIQKKIAEANIPSQVEAIEKNRQRGINDRSIENHLDGSISALRSYDVPLRDQLSVVGGGLAQLSGEIDNLKVSLPKMMRDLETHREALRRSLSVFRSVSALDHVHLGFTIPFGFAVGLLIASIFQWYGPVFSLCG